MFKIIFNIPRRFSQKAQRQESNLSLFLFLYVKASFIFVYQLGIHYSTIHRSHCAAGWIPTTPKDFFQVHRLISNWQCPLGQTMEMESLFQRLFHREHLLLPTLVLPNVWPGSIGSYSLSHSIQKAVYSVLVLCSSKISMLANWLELKLQCLFLQSPSPMQTPASFYQ